MAISGIGVAAVSVGALFIYAGLSGTNPLAAFKEIATGNPKAVDTSSHATGPSSGSGVAGTAPGGSGGLSGLAAVAYSQYGKDIYSQAKRSQPGFSDCSSFVSKAMRAYVPMYPMGVTGTFLFSGEWTTIKEASARPGDIAVNGTHMAIVGGRNSSGALIGVGQQRSGRNVQVDTIKNLMTGTGSYQVRRYRPKDLSKNP